MEGKSFTVLAVDDEEEALTLIQLMLQNTPFRIVTACSGQEALAKARSLPSIDIVLLDIMMPDLSGVTVCGYMRAMDRLRHVPIVMLTALDDYATRRKAIQAGATDLLTKPVSKQELIAKLYGVIAEQQARAASDWI